VVFPYARGPRCPTCRRPPGPSFPRGRRGRSPPADEILAEAWEWAADLVVLGTGGRPGARFHLGSTAAAALRGAPCSVLAVPGAAFRESPGGAPEAMQAPPPAA
jgi:hypothetical protein